MGEDRCERCARNFATNRRFAFPNGGAADLVCLRCALRHPSLVRRAGRVALVVGALLTAINQGDALLAGDLTAAMLWQVPLTFAVPYAVSTYSTLGAVRRPPAPAEDLCGRPDLDADRAVPAP